MSPGARLARARMRNGINTRTELSREAKKAGYTLSAHRIGRIERNEANPTIEEIMIICETLTMSADWWLMGDTVSADVLKRKVDTLSAGKRKMLMLIMEFSE